MVGVCGPMRKVSTMPAAEQSAIQCFFGSGMASHALPRANACSAAVILLEMPAATAEDSRLWAVWAMADQGSRAGTTRKGDLLADTFGDGDSAVNRVCRNR